MSKARRIPIKKGALDDPVYLQLINDLLASFEYIAPSLNESLGKVEPKGEFLKDGMLAYADGSNWNPGGTGKGYYRYNGATAAWVLIG